jgi:hypothetical protein
MKARELERRTENGTREKRSGGDEMNEEGRKL